MEPLALALFNPERRNRDIKDSNNYVHNYNHD